MAGQYIEPMRPTDRADPTPADGPSSIAAPRAQAVAGARARWTVGLGLPRPCMLCGQWDRQGLCGDCRQRFLAAPLSRCPRCALPGAAATPCGACLREPPPFERCITLGDYGFPWDRLIGRFKFQQQPELAALLAPVLQAAVQQQASAPLAQVVLPVPLSAQRLAERGYNQAWELARRVAAGLNLPAEAGWLLRLRDTPHQVGLSRTARTRNLRDAMWVTPQGVRGLAGRQIALIDDVLTTGVTAAAASQALLAAGAAGVQVWVLARTPAPGA
jgi:ComF family protein